MPKDNEERSERREVLDALSKTQKMLRYAHAEFNQTGEPELVEAAVYEINSLNARYAYLLRRVRELGIAN